MVEAIKVLIFFGIIVLVYLSLSYIFPTLSKESDQAIIKLNFNSHTTELEGTYSVYNRVATCVVNIEGDSIYESSTPVRQRYGRTQEQSKE